MDDASLDEFLDDESEDDGDAGASAPDGESGSVDPAAVDPATTTYSWSAQSESCENCGEPVQRRWRDDRGLVCEDCKEW